MQGIVQRIARLLVSFLVAGMCLPSCPAWADGISGLDPTVPIKRTPWRGSPPALKAAGDRKCAPAVSVRVELDLSQLAPAPVSSPDGTKLVTLPLHGSVPYQKEAVRCSYGSGKLWVSYLLACPLPVASSAHDTYHCRKPRLLLQTEPVPAPPIQR